MFYKLLIVALGARLVSCVCYNYLQGDTYFNQSVLNSSYCASIIRWPISNTTIKSYNASDNTAQSLYAALYNRYKNNDNNDGIDIDCLGIARYAFCAYAYPTCIPPDNYKVPSSDTSDKANVCQWLCDLWLVRCPTQFDVYDQMCRNQKGEVCSWEMNHQITLIVLLGLLVIL